MDESQVFAHALKLATPAERAAYLAVACGGNPKLQDDVEALLHAHDTNPGFLEQPAVALGMDTMPDSNLDAKAGDDLGFLTASDRPDSLGRVAHYEVLEVIGRGGMGIVLRVLDEKLHRVAAIKVMAAQLATSATARKRFTREAQAAAAVTHDHIVTIYAVDEAAGLPYLAMQYIAGVSLQERIDRSGPLQLDEILRIGMQTASGLAAAHAQGLIHRDIKPANILLENGVERVKITDFGLARAADDANLTQSGMVAGTPHYMSPEQAQGIALDQRSDLFSLGSVMYAMCTGRAPFRASGTMAVLKRVCEETPTAVGQVNSAIPAWLAAIIEKLHAKDPADRYPSAGEVAEVLGRHLAHVQHPSVMPLPHAVAEPMQTVDRPNRPQAAFRPWWTVAAVLLVLLFGGLSLTEATGVTRLVPTVIRIFTPDGTLVIKIDDPAVKVTIEGDGGLVISGAGPQEVRLRPGSYKVQADKDGKPVPLERDLISIARGGREVVKVKLEGPATADGPAWNGWLKDAPPPAIAPFDADAAKSHQEAWAHHLGVRVELTNSVGMRLRLIPTGEFRMGSPENEPDREAHEAQRQVKITKPFFLGTHAVTVGQFQSFVSETGYKSEAETDGGALIQFPGNVWRVDPKANWRSPGFEQTDDHPVTCISWIDAAAFCDWLSVKEGRRYTLPTEAQWEYACRAGSRSKFFFGDNDQELGEYAWFSSNSSGKTHPVGQKKPNAWGIYDVHGNVYQWTADWYAANYGNDLPVDPSGPASGKNRVLRGGAWCTNERRDRDAFRNGGYAPSSRANSFGFRIAIVDDLKLKAAAAQPEPGAFVVLGGAGIAVRTFETLAEALQVATDGDTIEIRGNGPFISEPINIQRTALTIRAGEGFRPLIRLNPEAAQRDVPLLATRAPLVLEGLDLTRTAPEDPVNGRYALIKAHQFSLCAANCRFSASIYPIGSECLFRNCEFLAAGGIGGRACPIARVVLENCLRHRKTYPLVLWNEDDSLQDVSIEINGCTFVSGYTLLSLDFGSHVPAPSEGRPASNPVRLEVSDSIVDTSAVLGFNEKRETAVPPPDAEAALLRLLLWRGKRNLFSTGSAGIKWAVDGERQPPHGPKTLDEWARFWGGAEAASLEGRIRFHGDSGVSRSDAPIDQFIPNDFRLRPDSAGYRAGPNGKDIGADVDLVGPGAAYERFKRTPEYQEWLKEIGQQE